MKQMRDSFCERWPLCHIKLEQNLTFVTKDFFWRSTKSFTFLSWMDKKARDGVFPVNEHSSIDTHIHLHTAQKQFVFKQVCIFKYLYIYLHCWRTSSALRSTRSVFFLTTGSQPLKKVLDIHFHHTFSNHVIRGSISSLPFKETLLRYNVLIIEQLKQCAHDTWNKTQSSCCSRNIARPTNICTNIISDLHEDSNWTVM